MGHAERFVIHAHEDTQPPFPAPNLPIRYKLACKGGKYCQIIGY